LITSLACENGHRGRRGGLRGRANPQAQALRRGRTTTYGLVIRNFNNPFFLEVLSGAEQAASEAGAALLLLDSRYSEERERMQVRQMEMGRALMARLLGGDQPSDYVAPVALVERASLQAPETRR
jgi:DNA-binding LacI/PurR family transcriptional regulator